MNAVEIEEAISALAAAPFNSDAFPYAFLEAFGNKETTIKKLRSGDSNKSDVPRGVLQRSNIHIAVCDTGKVNETLEMLRQSSATTKNKAKFTLATDGVDFQAESLADTEPPLVCSYADFANHFGYFLPLAGITTVKQIRENAFDIKATGRLNRLYVELLKTNPDWDTDARRQDLNHFFARLIFCFFAEDTHVFNGLGLFTETVEQMSDRDGSNTHEIISEMFRAMDIRREDRQESGLRPWAMKFPYVNGNLFGGNTDTPRFSKIARSYLLNVGTLDWKRINPDIFGSMIQAVADDEERGALGMHYTSVPNILKVLNPLFLDELRAKLAEAGDSPLKLLNLRKRLARIRVFDPACGSGNFLVIAYKEMRVIEAEINQRRGETDQHSELPLTNFRGIEIRHFAAEVARLALVIAKFQCDALYRGELLARAEFLPLERANWITCGNALRLDWLQICPPTGTGVRITGDDLFNTPKDQAEIDFENAGGETYICGNPPYLGSTWQTEQQKAELGDVFGGRAKTFKLLDYVAGWFMKAADYGEHTESSTAFVATNSICQGQQVPIIWPLIFATGHEIVFAHTSFNWSNLASNKAGVTVVIVGIAKNPPAIRTLISVSDDDAAVVKKVQNINAYLVPAPNVIVVTEKRNRNGYDEMIRGNTGNDGGHLYLTPSQLEQMGLTDKQKKQFVRQVFGSDEFINGITRYCIWIENEVVKQALTIAPLAARIAAVREVRARSRDPGARRMASRPHQFREMNQPTRSMIVVPRVSAEDRPYLQPGLVAAPTVISDRNFALYDAPLWTLALISSRLHLVWVATVCVRLRKDYSYSNTLGWNTFPVPMLSDLNKAELTRRAEEIVLTRESHFPATIADLYNPERMPGDLRSAHDHNDETLERIYIGRRFRNDTERLEKLFEMYTEMTAKQLPLANTKSGKRKAKGNNS